MQNVEFDRACAVLSQIVHPETLSHRIVVLLAEGKSRKVITRETGRSVYTIGDYLKDLYEKTGLHDRVLFAAAVRRVFLAP